MSQRNAQKNRWAAKRHAPSSRSPTHDRERVHRGDWWCVRLVVCGYFGRVMLSFLPATAEAWQFSPDRRIFALTFLVAFTSGLLFGLAPVIQLGRHQAAALRSRSGSVHTVRRKLDSREVLTVIQIALTILLVTGAGLFARTLQNLRDADMGFDRDHILLASIDPAKSGYTRAQTAVFFAELLQRLRLRSHENIASESLSVFR
jgi:hypothetical protein